MTDAQSVFLTIGVVSLFIGIMAFAFYSGEKNSKEFDAKWDAMWKKAEAEYDSLSPEEKNKTEQQTKRFVQGFLPNNTFTENGVTVSYNIDPLKALFTDSEKWEAKKRTIETKVRDILRHSHDPQTDLNLHAPALGILNISVSTKPAPPPTTYHTESSTRRRGFVGTEKKD